AAHIGDEAVRRAALRRRLRLVVESPEGTTTAAVDAVGLDERWLAARAVWRPEDLIEAVVARADPGGIGMVGVAAAFGELDEDRVRYLRFGPGQLVRVAFGPGLVKEVEVAEIEDLPAGHPIPLSDRTGV